MRCNESSQITNNLASPRILSKEHPLKKLGLYITNGSHQSGELHIQGDVQIDGSFSGKLTSEGDLFLGETSSFDGEAHVLSAYIEGTFSGALEAKKQTILASSAKFNGILDTPKAEIKIGAEIIGDVRICNRRKT